MTIFKSYTRFKFGAQRMGGTNEFRHTFKVFKKSIKFRKHSTGLTKFKKRRKQIKRLRYNSFSLVLNLLKAWSVFYMKSRQFWRFYHTAGQLVSVIPCTDIVLYYARMAKKTELPAVNIFSCSHSVLNYYLDNTKHDMTYLSCSLTSSNNSYLLTAEDPLEPSLNAVSPTVLKFETLHYSLDSYISKSEESAHTAPVSISPALPIEVELYKVLILLTLHNM